MLVLQSGAQPREQLPLAELEARAAEKSHRLVELGEPPLMVEEAMAARLYTGPCFIKYNGVLRVSTTAARTTALPLIVHHTSNRPSERPIFACGRGSTRTRLSL